MATMASCKNKSLYVLKKKKEKKNRPSWTTGRNLCEETSFSYKYNNNIQYVPDACEVGELVYT